MLAQSNLRLLTRTTSKRGDSLILPFLYCTTTILNPGITYGIGRHYNRLDRVRTYTSTKTSNRVRRPRAPPQTQRGSKSQDDHVPFEGLPSEDIPDPEATRSTITPSERKAFESLLATAPKKDSAALVIPPSSEQDAVPSTTIEDEYEQRARALDSILETAAEDARNARGPALSPVLQDIMRKGRDQYQEFRSWVHQKRLSNVEEEGQLGKALQEEELRVYRRMKNACRTDAEVWRVFQKTVVDVLVKMLSSKQNEQDVDQLPGILQTNDSEDVKEMDAGDGKSLQASEILANAPDPITLSSPPKKGQHDPLESVNGGVMAQDASPPASSAQNHSTRDPAALSRLLSYHTRSAQLVLAERYRSPLALSVLPTIRNLGPIATAFVLGHQHYRIHLHELWHQYQDLPAMLALLQLMDDEVVKFDESSANTIREVLDFADRAQKGKFGESMKVIWTMDAKMEYVKAMEEWYYKLGRYRQEEELRRVRVEDAEVEGVIERRKFRYEKRKPVDHQRSAQRRRKSSQNVKVGSQMRHRPLGWRKVLEDGQDLAK